jgi:hypothetical protein
MIDRSFDHITVNRTNSLGSIECSIEYPIIYIKEIMTYYWDLDPLHFKGNGEEPVIAKIRIKW